MANIVQVNNKTYPTPSNWDELSKKQILQITSILNSDLSLPEGKIKLIKELSKIKWKLFFKFTDDQVYDLLSLSDFIFKNNDLSRAVIPHFRIGLRKYYSPGNKLGNLSIEEFSYADTFYMKHKQTNEIEWLNLLIVTLYRPKTHDHRPDSVDYKGDIREEFNSYILNFRSEKISKLKNKTKFAILLFYEGCRNIIIKQHPHVFTKNKPKGKDFGWGGTLVELAGNKFGTHEQTKKANLWDVMGHLEMEAIKAKELDNQYQKIKNKYRK